MPFDIDQLKSNMQFGGARPTQFDVIISPPAGLGLTNNQQAVTKIQYSCEAASLPGQTQGTIRIPFFGRLIPFAGDTQFQPWETTIINDEDFVARNLIEDWLNKINARKRNIRVAADSRPSNYKGTAEIFQYNQVGQVIRRYKLVDCYPTLASPISMSWAAQNEVERFQVVWEYSYFEPLGATASGLSPS